MEAVLPPAAPAGEPAAAASYGTRGAAYAALGLLWRDAPGDRRMAESTLRWVLSMQYDDPPGSPRFGVWRTRPGETDHDPNWREFVGCGLSLTQELFGNRLPEELNSAIAAALDRAAEGAAARRVAPSYTNIALMNAFLLDWVGNRHGREDLSRMGGERAAAVYRRFKDQGTFDEYNSPTYYGTDLMALSLWRQYASTSEMRNMGADMEAALWRDIAAFYHAGMKNLCGPYVRAYGVDMNSYCALVGLWMALTLDDPGLAPWPSDPAAMHPGERIYGPIFALIGSRVPDDALPHLRAFQGPRELERRFGNTQARAVIRQDWMMGAAALARSWDQHHPAVIHWIQPDTGSVRWLSLSGLSNGVTPDIADKSLVLTRSEGSDTIEFYCNAVGQPDEGLSSHAWKLQGMLLSAETAPGVALKTVEAISHPRYGPCTRIVFSLPREAKSGDRILRLTPQPLRGQRD
ncbi:MAG: hypothetical protein GYA33_10370 [Thermogutta sp.]|nr:hypothetical protein [Thermogutta sp.]